MKIELTIDRNKSLPTGVVPALEKELSGRLEKLYADCHLVIRRAGSDGLNIYGAGKEDKVKIEALIQEVWESADDWFY
ncbi:DinI family protein [Cronobacter sp. EKM101R]|uniref:DinI family protein n=1 Tax=Cronobacter TaxID=413496 RepID=UPI0013EAFF78|nr:MULTISPECIES: DinI family protein [Cronobacter]KAF6589111.1 DinI family protein [Cronobacter sp. EKM101R]KAF6592406.1 DinI family protein [Cronobacter sp. EKM102R]MDK1185199.1 DinI family protein [Cronobacter turicensis]MDK1216826.1 DinI family protein [Cronobacter turicensis]MDK1219437.1 DinI family protein [Cronobacter turicensis]